MPPLLSTMLLSLVLGIAVKSKSPAVDTQIPLSFIHVGGQTKEGFDNNFYDGEGRIRIFHGANRVQKGFPWYFQDMLEEDANFQLMQDLGFTVVRLGFMWSGYNPHPNYFNGTYIEIIKTIIGKFNNHGIYVLLDMHQDGLSSKFCLYDGAPLWVIDKSMPKHEFPWPLTGNCSRNWEMNELTEACGKAYQDLYDNHDGMLDDLASFWGHAAAEFKDIPGIIGYEIMNEPFAGDFYADPLILVPGIAGKTNLQKMHDAVAKEIRKHDETHAIFFEPVTWGMIFDSKIVGSGFDHVPGGVEYSNRSVLSYHYYCASFLPGWEGQPMWTKAVCDDVVGPLVFEAVTKDVQGFGGGRMMTEGMACGDRTESECQTVMADLDKRMLSWTDYGDSQGPEFLPSSKQQLSWSRTHARAISGTPLNMSFDPTTKDFEFYFEPNVAIKHPTEIFASVKYQYTCGADVTTSPNVLATPSQHNADVWFITPATTTATSSSSSSSSSLLSSSASSTVAWVKIKSKCNQTLTS